MTQRQQQEYDEMQKTGKLTEKSIEVRHRSDIASLFQTLSFPVSKIEVLQYCNSYEFQWTQQEPIMVKDVVAEIPQETFNSLVDLVDAICSAIQLAYGDKALADDTAIIKKR